MKNWIIVLCLLGLISCGKTILNAELEIPFKMTNEQTVKINETDLKFDGFKIVEDSRCPESTNCIWAGQVVAEFDLNGSPLKFNSYQSKDTLGYTFKITAIEPIKKEGVDIPLSTYILEILISE